MRAGFAIRLALLVLLVAFLASPQSFAFLLGPLTRNGQPAIYVQNSLLNLALSHVGIVAVFGKAGHANTAGRCLDAGKFGVERFGHDRENVLYVRGNGLRRRAIG